MKRALRTVAFLLGIVFAVCPALEPQEQSLDGFFNRIKRDLESRDTASYLEKFSPEAREAEGKKLAEYFNNYGMENIVCRFAGRETDPAGESLEFLQILFHNSHAAIIENWQLTLEQANGGWQIKKKDITSSLKNLFKIRMPNERAERAASVEISHTDIRLAFENALVFYDNIPEMETALLVIGKGRLRFSPSNSIERHQLQLVYKKPFLEDRLQYAFIRCSDNFFRTHIRITKSPGRRDLPATTDETNRASAAFIKNYPRSFTVKDSVTGNDLSALPNGEEAVFDFEGEQSGELTYIYSPFSEEEVNLYDRVKERVISLYSPRSEEEPKLRRFVFRTGERFDIRNYQIDVDYSPGKSYLSAKARITFEALGEAVEGLKFKISSDLEILRVIDAEKRELFFTKDELRKLLYVYFVKPLDQGVSDEIEVYYRGKIIPLPPNTDIVGRISDTGRYRFVEPYAKIKTFLFAHSTLWYPSPPEDDYFTSRLKIIVPPEYTCISGGELVDKGHLKSMDEVVEIEKTGHSFFTFETRAPVKQLSFIVGKFSLLEERRDPLPLESFASVDIMGAKKSLLADAGEILRHYARWFGPYPFERLTLVQRLWPSDGGHSPASFIVLNETPWFNRRSFSSRPNSPVDLAQWKEYFLAHEIAHQWWGQGVAVGSYKDQWLSEGLAQFAAALYLRERYGTVVFASIMRKFSAWAEKKSSRGPIILGARLSYRDFEAYQAIIYNKSALVLNMLRDLLGDEAFFKGLSDFYKNYQFRAARTGQFREAMEKASGMDLNSFFQGWFFSYLLPDVKVSRLLEKDGETDKLLIRIQQEGATFIFPLWIEWKIGGRTFREMVVVDSASREFKIPLSGRPSSVRINPDHAVPGRFKMLKIRPGKASPKIEEPQERKTASVARLRKPITFSNPLSNKRNFGVGNKEES